MPETGPVDDGHDKSCPYTHIGTVPRFEWTDTM